MRTTLFLAGCGLRCQWCANPESWTLDEKLAFYQHKCNQCGECLKVCPSGLDPLSLSRFESCQGCRLCEQVCAQKALLKVCQPTRLQHVIDKIKRDNLFFRYSGGGVTLSGGEPFLQPQFAGAIAHYCHVHGISIWAETCGLFDWKKVSPFIDKFEHIYFDVKLMDAGKHIQYTGRSNRSILKNLLKIYQVGVPITIRIPLISGVNDSDENVNAMAQFLARHLSQSRVQILQYHELGKAKYLALKMEDKFHSFCTPSPQKIQHVASILSQHGLEVVQEHSG